MMRLEQVSRYFETPAGRVVAVDDVSCEFPPGRITAIMGPSGSGKSTLMQCAAGLDTPTHGAVLLGQDDLAGMDEDQLGVVRRERLGFIFQAFNLVPMLTVAHNIALPRELAGRDVDDAEVDKALEQVGLAGLGRRYPAELSGGQQQRTAIARTLLSRPDVLFADEPTGSLDVQTGHQILALLRDAADRVGQTVVMVTHDPAAATIADRVLYMVDGQIRGETREPTLPAVMAQITSWGQP